MAFFPDELRKCVAFLGYRRADGGEGLAGSTFFLARYVADDIQDRTFQYAVTARHVIDGIRKKGLDKVWIRANHRTGVVVGIETPIGQWVFHDDPTVDVAVLKIVIPEELDHKLYLCQDCDITAIKQGMEPPQVGDEIFITGLFWPHYGKRKNIPIVRVGNIAALPDEDVMTKLGPTKAYLVEARSIGGLSGSPVFVNLAGFRGGNIIAGGQFFLMGLMHGHFDIGASNIDAIVDDGLEKTNVNMGVGIVIPSERILEVIRKFEGVETKLLKTSGGKECLR